MKKSHHYRFFVKPDSIVRDIFLSTDKELVNQIKNVFRLKKGDQITILDNTGFSYSVDLLVIESGKVSGGIIEKKASLESPKEIRLFCPLLKGENFELVLQKCTEIGVTEFCPVIYSNSIVKNHEIKDRWLKLIKEASEQSMRSRMPGLSSPARIEEVLSAVKGQANLAAYEEERRDIASILGNTKKFDKINIFVGPEGGFTDVELEKMEKARFEFFRLGDTVLRSETACILSTGILRQFMLK